MLYAGFWMRFAAWLVDTVVELIMGAAIGIVLGVIDLKDFAGPVGFVVGTLYYSLMESSEWQATIGKRMLNLRVTDLEGRRISFWRALARNLAKLFSGLILGVGYFMAGWTTRKQALHDVIAGCLVLRN